MWGRTLLSAWHGSSQNEAGYKIKVAGRRAPVFFHRTENILSDPGSRALVIGASGATLLRSDDLGELSALWRFSRLSPRARPQTEWQSRAPGICRAGLFAHPPDQVTVQRDRGGSGLVPGERLWHWNL